MRAEEDREPDGDRLSHAEPAAGNCRQSRRPGSPGLGCDSPMRARTRRLVNKARTLRGTARPRHPSRTLTPAGALLRSRPAAVCRQPRCASHHQAAHTGRLSTIAYTAIAIGPSSPATTDAATVTAPEPDPRPPRPAPVAEPPQPPATERQRQAAGRDEDQRSGSHQQHRRPTMRTGSLRQPVLRPETHRRRAPQARPAAKAAPAARTRGPLNIPRSSMAIAMPGAEARIKTRGAAPAHAFRRQRGAWTGSEAARRESGDAAGLAFGETSDMTALTYAGIGARATPFINPCATSP